MVSQLPNPSCGGPSRRTPGQAAGARRSSQRGDADGVENSGAFHGKMRITWGYNPKSSPNPGFHGKHYPHANHGDGIFARIHPNKITQSCR